MARPREAERVIVDTYIVLEQRVGVCVSCGSRYTGIKKSIPCLKCKSEIVTVNVNCNRRIPTGQWTFFREPVDRKDSDEGSP